MLPTLIGNLADKVAQYPTHETSKPYGDQRLNHNPSFLSHKVTNCSPTSKQLRPLECLHFCRRQARLCQNADLCDFVELHVVIANTFIGRKGYSIFTSL